MAHEPLIKWMADRPEIESFYAAVFDLNGTLRGKRLPVAQLEKVLDGGMRMPLSIGGVDIWGQDIVNSELVFETGDADGICEFTGRGILPMPWLSHPTALVPVWLAEEGGAPFRGDPRRALADIVARYKAIGLTPVVATELEFYLVDPSTGNPQPPISPVTGNRIETDGVLSMDELTQFGDFLGDVYAACKAQGIQADVATAENGAGQFEFNMMHVNDPLRAADDAALFKQLVRGVARNHGFAATFMAKPYGNRSGSGFHVHFSLVDEDGNNVFDNGTEEGAPILLNAVAGLLETMSEHTLIFAPHENSFRRLVPGAHAPSAAAWGYENRTTAVRIPGGSPKARRIEHRVAGADANPYLVLASILGGALLGIERELTPVAAITGDAYSQDLPQLPADWSSAIVAFEQGRQISDIYATRLRRMFAGCKRQEYSGFKSHISEFEIRSYLESV
ncbi:MAG: glutamine synthetase [Robiginitomaculum sp.]|nr:MAG: glutamine synthetase [Robiginitomaculum sp.]